MKIGEKRSKNILVMILLAIILLPVMSSAQTTPAKDGMVLVEGGSFMMGGSGYDNEMPIHRVTLKSFYISKTEVTVGEFEQFITATGYKTDAEKGGGSWVWTGSTWGEKDGVTWRDDEKGERRGIGGKNYAVIHVSWNDATAYCKWKRQRLPTEAEWEYAARGGNKGKGYEYSGSNKLDEIGWYMENSGYKVHYVGEKLPNELGIYDMTGNVSEWCSDWFGANYYYNSPKNNPQGASSSSNRVMRGGSWNGIDHYCRVALRNSNLPDGRGGSDGFRTVKD